MACFMCIYTIYSKYGTNFTIDDGNYKFNQGNVKKKDVESCKISGVGHF
jgi:hypothetical protein